MESWTFQLPSLRFGVLDGEPHPVHGLFCAGPWGLPEFEPKGWGRKRQTLGNPLCTIYLGRRPNETNNGNLSEFQVPVGI